MDYATTIAHVLNAGMAPTGGVQLHREAGLTVEQAEQKAAGDRKVNFFTRDSSTGETVFYRGDFTSLQPNATLNTHVVVETVDTTKAETREQLLSDLRTSFLGPAATTWSPKPGEPTKQVLQAGIAMCTFRDVQTNASEIPRLVESLLGGPLGTTNELDKFLSIHSNDTREIQFQLINPQRRSAPTWIEMPFAHDAHPRATLYGEVMRELDKRFEFDDELSFIFVGFPDEDLSRNPSSNQYEQAGGNWLYKSECVSGQIVDRPNDQNVSFVFVDPARYADTSTHACSIHEILHALSLPDLYGNGRSFRWSAMSAMMFPYLTAFERLTLGWLETSEVVFLVRGTVAAEELTVDGGTTKMVVIVPEQDVRDDFHLFEVAQTVDADRRGLLLMQLTKHPVYGKLVPFVNDREVSFEALRDPSASKDDAANQEMNEGGARAPFGAGTSVAVNGVFAHSIKATQNGGFTATIGVERGFGLAGSAKQLRETETLVSADGMHTFGLSPIGQPLLNGTPRLNVLQNGPGSTTTMVESIFASDLDWSNQANRGVEMLDLGKRGFGFCLFVADDGRVHLAAATKPVTAAEAWPANRRYFILKSFGEALPTSDDYEMALRAHSGKAYLTISSKKTGKSYDLFETDKGPKLALPLTQGRYKIEFYGTDGNLMVARKDATGPVYAGIGQTNNALGAVTPSTLSLDSQQRLGWQDKDGKTVRSIGGLTTTSGPLRLKVLEDGPDKWGLHVVDKAGVALYPVMGYSIGAKWSLTTEDYRVDFSADTGVFTVTEVANGAKHTTKATIGEFTGVTGLSFDTKGGLSWNQGSAPVKSIWGTEGAGPYFIDIAKNHNGATWSLVVKAQNGDVLYSLLDSNGSSDFQSQTGYLQVTATTANLQSGRVEIDHADLNDKPDAVALVTQWFPVDTLTGVFNNSHVGLTYDTGRKRWQIFNTTSDAIPVGARFNVFWTPATRNAFSHEIENTVYRTVPMPRPSWASPTDLTPTRFVTASRVIGRPGTGPEPKEVTSPDALVFAAHAKDIATAKDPMPGVGVEIDKWTKSWAWIQKDEGSVIGEGQRFNVVIHDKTDGPRSAVFRHTSNATNSINNYTRIDHPLLNGNPNAVLVVTPVWKSPHDNPLGVWYQDYSARWTVFNQVASPAFTGTEAAKLQPDLEFNVWVKLP